MITRPHSVVELLWGLTLTHRGNTYSHIAPSMVA